MTTKIRGSQVKAFLSTLRRPSGVPEYPKDCEFPNVEVIEESRHVHGYPQEWRGVTAEGKTVKVRWTLGVNMGVLRSAEFATVEEVEEEEQQLP